MISEQMLRATVEEIEKENKRELEVSTVAPVGFCIDSLQGRKTKTGKKRKPAYRKFNVLSTLV